MTNLNAHQFPDLDDPQGLLEPDPLYHGTSSFEPKVGDKILPPNKSGAKSYWGHLDDQEWYGQSVKGNAYATTDENTAWSFAEQRAGEPGNHSRPAVYRVKPNGPHEPGDETSNYEVRSPHGFEVTGRIDTRPGQQGTIPTINWAQHAKYLNPFDANHPTDYAGDGLAPAKSYPQDAGYAADAYMQRQTQERRATEKGQGELFDSSDLRGYDTTTKAYAMKRYMRGEINEDGMPETRKFAHLRKSEWYR